MSEYVIAVVPGDGIGPEVTQVTQQVLARAAELRGDLTLHFDEHDASATRWMKTGVAMPDSTYDACERADAVLLGAIGLPEARHDDGREVNGDVIFRLRLGLDLFTGVRPIKAFRGLAPVLARGPDVDYVIVRENTEGLYASRSAGVNVREEVVTDTLVITSRGSRRICETAFGLAARRQGRPSDGKSTVTCVDKANVLASYAFFRSVFDDVAAGYGHIGADHQYVDAMTAVQVLRPDQLDVVVTENMFGDIISDLGAATVGGLGLAPSADIGDRHGMFQPAHGSAPDIAGRDVANPLAAVLSGGMMLDWLGHRHRDPAMLDAAADVERAVAALLAGGRGLPVDLGGSSSTSEVGRLLLHDLNTVES